MPISISAINPTTPEEALARVRRHDGFIIVDLDETIYLRNSTEDYIDTAQPMIAAAISLRVLEAIKPWRWTGGPRSADLWRVQLISFLFPWTHWLWRQRVRVLSTQFCNEPLVSALRESGRTFAIATLGFEKITKPLIDAMGLQNSQLIACRSNGPRDKLRGKLAIVADVLGPTRIAEALVVTDSLDDTPLLMACGHPVLTAWPGARFVPAFRKGYVPFQYLEFVKRPRSGAVKTILIEDFAVWALASLPLATKSVFGFPGLILLFVSFWAIYERCYIENDIVAATLEADPKLTPAFNEFDPRTIRFGPWIYALGFGLGGVAFLHHASYGDFGIFALTWLGVLVGTRLLFRIYNHLDKATRVWLYLGLQLMRAAAIFAVVPINPPGVMLCAALASTRWHTYLLYRHLHRSGLHEWPEIPHRLMRLLLFLALMILGVVGGMIARSWAPVAALMIFWMALLARADIIAIFRHGHWLDRTRGL